MPFKTSAQGFMASLVVGKAVKISSVRLRALFTDNWGSIHSATQKKIDQGRNPVRGSKSLADDVIANLKKAGVNPSEKFACMLIKQRKVFVAVLNKKAVTAKNVDVILEFSAAAEAAPEESVPEDTVSALDDLMADALSIDLPDLEPEITEAPYEGDPLADMMDGLDDMEAQLSGLEAPDEPEADPMDLLEDMEAQLSGLDDLDLPPTHPWADGLPRLQQMLTDSHGNTVALIDRLKAAKKDAPALSQERERVAWMLSVYLNDGVTKLFVPVRAPLMDLQGIANGARADKLPKIMKKARKNIQTLQDWLDRVSIPVDAAAGHLNLSTNLRALNRELHTFVSKLGAEG